MRLTKLVQSFAHVSLFLFKVFQLNMSVHINDLCCDLLIYLLSFLPSKQIFMIECVSKKWKKCVDKLMERRITELDFFNKEWNYGRYFLKNKLSLSFPYYIIDHNNIDHLKVVLSKYSNIKHFSLSNIIVSVNNLISIVNLCPKLERIEFSYSKINGNEKEWEQFNLIIRTKLIKCEFNYNSFKFLNSEIFYHLNSCKLSISCSISCQFDNHHNIETSDQNTINILEKVNYLSMYFCCFGAMNIEWNNLTELILIFDGRNFNGYSNDINPNIMTFPCLKILIIMTLMKHNFSLNVISKWKFPNLEYLSFRNFMRLYDWIGWNDALINKIKNIRMFDCRDHKFDLKLLILLEKLTEFEFEFSYDNKNDIKYLIQLFDVVSKHKSLKKIKLTFGEGLFNVKIFEKLITLHHAKPNLNIKIHDYNGYSLCNYNKELIKQYKKKHEETKHLTKINIFHSDYYSPCILFT